MNKKSIITIACGFIGFLVLLLIILWVISLFSHKYFTYEEVENKMISATETFYKNHPEILPVNDGRSTLSYNTLVENGYIKPLNELLSDGDSCSAEMSVIKSGNDYSYIPKLTCSDKYSTIELAQHILKKYDVTTTGSGLYSDGDGGYYFKGKITDNYIELGNNHDPFYSEKDMKVLWRIIGIDKNNRLKILSTMSAKNTKYDNRYNEGQKMALGYNDFEMSVIKDRLKTLESTEDFLTNQEKGMLSKSKLCIGKRTAKDETKDGSTECSVLSNDEYLFGLIVPYEYIRASIDENCKTMKSLSCQNYNYLYEAEQSYNWTLTADPENDYQVYVFNGKTFYSYDANNMFDMRLTAYLNPYTIYKAGDGTIENPYKLFK